MKLKTQKYSAELEEARAYLKSYRGKAYNLYTRTTGYSEDYFDTESKTELFNELIKLLNQKDFKEENYDAITINVYDKDEDGELVDSYSIV